MKRALLLPVLMFVLLPGAASGATRQWQGTVDDDWYVPGNWNPSGAPDPTDDLQVYSGTPETTIYVTVSSGGSIEVDGTGTSASFGYLYPGFTGNGYIDVTSGASLSSSATYMGYSAGSDGVVYVTGAGTNWTNSGDLAVGYYGEAYLGVYGGTASTADASIASQSGSDGGVSVYDSGSWTVSGSVYVGGSASAAGGTGRLTVEDDGQVTVGDTLKVWDTGQVLLLGLLAREITAGSFIVESGGTFTHSGGTLTVDGGTFDPGTASHTIDGAWSPTLKLINGATGSLSDTLYVGDSNDGTLILESGATLSTASCEIGLSAGSNGQASIDGTGSTWTNSSDLVVGSAGTGVLAISNEATVSSGGGLIGDDTGVSGEVTVDGGSWTSTGWLCVGSDGTAVLTVTNGGTVSNSTVANIGQFYASDGTVTVDGAGSTWTSSGSVYVGGYSFAAGGTGTLTVKKNGEVNVGDTLKIWDTGTVELLSGRINTESFVVETGGTFTHTGGTLTVDGGTFDPVIGYYDVDGANDPTLKLINGASASLSGDVNVASTNQGTLILKDGATFANETCFVGRYSGSNGQVTIDGTGSSWMASDDVCVGIYGNGVLTATNGGTVSGNFGYIGYVSGSTGSVVVSGAGSAWTSADSLYVGGDDSSAGGTGELTVRNAGKVNVGDTLKVWDTSTVQLLGGAIDTGSFVIESGGTFTHTGGTLTVDGGTFDPGTSSYTIDGTGSPTLKLINAAGASLGDELYVAQQNEGTFVLESGAVCTNTDGWIGAEAGSNGQASIDGSGSSWTNSGTLCVGYYGSGGLIVRNGGAVSSDTGRVGYRSGSLGAANVAGAGSTWTNTDSLDVGAASGATGVLSVRNGGEVTATNTVKIWPSGAITLDGGLVSSTTVTNQGLIIGVGDVQADLVNEGTLSPGLSAGVMTVEGDFTQDPAGTLKIELAGSMEHDVLEVTGAAELEGHLEVLPVVGFFPSYGETFTILTAGVLVNGEFGSINGPVVDVTYNPKDVVITTTLMGDANLDGFVAGEDYTIWADHYHDCGVTWVEGDFNGDGCVGGADYTIWADNYTGRGGSSVPEPAALWLLASGLARLVLRRRK